MNIPASSSLTSFQDYLCAFLQAIWRPWILHFLHPFKSVLHHCMKKDDASFQECPTPFRRWCILSSVSYTIQRMLHPFKSVLQHSEDDASFQECPTPFWGWCILSRVSYTIAWKRMMHPFKSVLHHSEDDASFQECSTAFRGWCILSRVFYSIQRMMHPFKSVLHHSEDDASFQECPTPFRGWCILSRVSYTVLWMLHLHARSNQVSSSVPSELPSRKGVLSCSVFDRFSHCEIRHCRSNESFWKEKGPFIDISFGHSVRMCSLMPWKVENNLLEVFYLIIKCRRKIVTGVVSRVIFSFFNYLMCVSTARFFFIRCTLIWKKAPLLVLETLKSSLDFIRCFNETLLWQAPKQRKTNRILTVKMVRILPMQLWINEG